MANLVTVDGRKINKAGTRCNIDSKLAIEEVGNRYVSRGGKKLEKAIKEFSIEIENKIVIDIGASTGGFTDYLLRHGAQKIFCVDVGYGQLDWTLRDDQRIVNMEKTNIRYLDQEQFNTLFDLATIDVSFISLEKVLPVVKMLLKPEGQVIALVKPQFEAGKEKVKKGGIVDDPKIHHEILTRIVRIALNDFQFRNVTFSPIKNSPGNIEYFLYLIKKTNNVLTIPLDLIEKTVTEAHQYFFKKSS